MESKTAIAALAALAQENRLAIFRLLVEQGPTGISAGEIGAALKIAPATLSFHLKELAHAGLVEPRNESRYIYYSANFARMNDLVMFLTENCCAADGTACLPGAACSPKGAKAAAASTPAKPAPTKSKRKGVKS